MKTETHPVEMLLDLVISDDLDPWDIDLTDIADRFIRKVQKMRKLNLRLSGKTLLASSILLRMKSDCLIPNEELQIEEEFGWGHIQNESTEELIPFKTPVRRRSKRKTTLFELIDALQRALSEEMIRKNFPKKDRIKPKLIIPIDEENIKERMSKIYDMIKELTKANKLIKFSDLVSGKREEIIKVLIALLHLDSQRKITIWQKEIFGEIFITLR